MDSGHPPTLYALFAGIDAYPPVVRSLHGCVNDVSRLQALLRERMQGEQAPFRFESLLLSNAQATRQGIIDAFRAHLGQARVGDVALFCYAGHGSQENAPPEFWDFEPDRLNETLVCYDSRLDGGWDLADKELAQLISEVAANGPHLAVILDCCHAGSGTRDAEDIAVRQEKADRRARPIASYIVAPQQAAGLQGRQQGAAMPWASLASGRHILLAACRPDQTAKEVFFSGPGGVEKRGAFSFYLQDTLQQSGAALSYRDLFKRVNALVQARVPDQYPQLEASEPADLEQIFLGGAIPAAPATFSLSRDKNLGWVIDAGAVHGIPQPLAGGETTQLAIFPFDADPARLRSLEQAIGRASVIQVFAGQSLVAPAPTAQPALDPMTTYKAVVTGTPLPPLAVAFEGDAGALDFVRQALANAGGIAAPSLLLRESELAGAEYRLLADAGQGSFRIRRAADALRLAVDTPGLNNKAAMIVVQRLEHIARWSSIARLANPATQIPRDAVGIDILCERDGRLEPLEPSSGLRLEYEQVEGGWRWPRLRIRLRNTTADRRLFCMLLDLTESYSISTGLLSGGGAWLEPGQDTWATALTGGRLGKTIHVTLPNTLWRRGVTELRDILKLIASTDEADATLLQQGELPITALSPKMRSSPRQSNTLNRLMARVHTRAVRVAPGREETFSDWTTAEVALTVVRPAEATITV